MLVRGGPTTGQRRMTDLVSDSRLEADSENELIFAGLTRARKPVLPGPIRRDLDGGRRRRPQVSGPTAPILGVGGPILRRRVMKSRMRSFSLIVVATALIASIGYTFLREGPVQAVPGRDGGAIIVAESIDGEHGDDSVKPMTVLASLLGESKESFAEPSKSRFYQWVDERGSVNFAASLDEVPEAWRQRAGQVELDAGSFTMTKTSLSGVTPSRRPQPSPASLATPAREVTVYTAPWCGWCRKTLAFLDERGVGYVNKDIGADEEYADELREKTGGTAIPLVEIDGTQIRGFDPREMATLLD